MRLLLVALAALVLATTAQAAGPITDMRYSPKPLYDDEIGVTVSFTAARQARRGYEWGAMLTVFTKEDLLSCASILVSWDPNFGGNRKRHLQRAGRHSILLIGARAYGSYICRGRATLRVVEHKIGSSGLGVWHQELRFRVPEAP